jgi:hypothetical protein
LGRGQPAAKGEEGAGNEKEQKRERIEKKIKAGAALPSVLSVSSPVPLHMVDGWTVCWGRPAGSPAVVRGLPPPAVRGTARQKATLCPFVLQLGNVSNLPLICINFSRLFVPHSSRGNKRITEDRDNTVLQ